MKNEIRLKLRHYKFTENDADILLNLKECMEENLDNFVKGFYEFIFEFEHAKVFINSEIILKKHKVAISTWFLDLFCGTYDLAYFKSLYKISDTHIKIHLPAIYINASFSYVRKFVRNILIEQKKYDEIASFEKILDINLDILTITSKQEEQNSILDDVVFLRTCIKNKKIEPYFQPIYSVKNPTQIKYESLMRLININNKRALSVLPYLTVAKK